MVAQGGDDPPYRPYEDPPLAEGSAMAGALGIEPNS